MKILALNCGSSSVKYQLFNWNTNTLLAKGIVERVGIGDSFIIHEVPGRETLREEYECNDHDTAINLVIKTLIKGENKVIEDIKEIAAVGHRVVHGGEKFKSSVEIDDEVIAAIESVQHLAPLHNPPNLSGIRAARALLPTVPHVAIFDTAFHQTMPRKAYTYAVPYEWYEKYGVRRYGFHGTSHLYVAKRASVMLGKNPKDCNLITLHIGNGASFCAIKEGISIDTSMGLTPLEGAVMGTRSGDIDPAIPLFMQKQLNVDAYEMCDILNKKSGILGLTGKYTDRRDVLDGEEHHDIRCKIALEVEAYRIKKYIGAYYATLGSLDAIIFTAGVGENAWLIRQMALEGLDNLGIELDFDKNFEVRGSDGESEISTPSSKVKIFVIPTDEERVFIEDVVAIMTGTYKNHTQYPYTFLK